MNLESGVWYVSKASIASNCECGVNEEEDVKLRDEMLIWVSCWVIFSYGSSSYMPG